jgi:serine/threonine-protein kinase HipA
MKTTKLNVFIKFSKEEELVGQLVLDGRDILFKYSEDYLKIGYNLSPLKLKFDNSIQTAPTNPFDGLFGVFADSLPDAWGKLLMKRQLSNLGIAIETLNSLDYLALSRANRFGALVYKPSVSKDDVINTEIDLDILNKDVKEVLKGESSEIIDELFKHGGSPGGARPKIYVGYNKKEDSLINGSEVLPKDYAHWIVKFAASIDLNDIANIEMAYYYMALDAGIIMNESKLFTGKNDKKYFGTKRFDRIGNDKLHMISAAGLLHDDYEHSQLDYGTLMYEAQRLTGSAETQEKILRLAAFNVFAHNRDDHSKNFAFIISQKGEWEFAPAYDLTFSSSSQGQHSTTCARNGINPGTKELLELANDFSIKKGKEIIQEVKESVSKWNYFADKAEVSKTSKQLIEKVINDILKR